MLPALTALIALQRLDTDTEARRKRLAELPMAEDAIGRRIVDATAAVETASDRQTDNQTRRRALEKDVAAVDSRLARFDDHKAAVKTNQEYTALLHEIAGAKAEKDAIEEQILLLMEEADAIAAEVKAAQAMLATTKSEAVTARQAINDERRTLEAELRNLGEERARHAATVEPRSLALYNQLIKGRRGVAVATMVGDMCTACHVRLRPHITQVIRRNEEIVQCESCQRILHFETQVPA